MLFLIVSLAALLLYRLGYLRPFEERRRLDRFDRTVLQLGEEVEWQDRMARLDYRLPEAHRLPSLQLK